MRVRKAAGLGNAMGLCALYAAAPALGRALLDLVLPRARFSALKALAGAMNSPLPVVHLAGLLGFCGRQRGRQLLEVRGASTLPGCMRRVLPGKHAPAVRPLAISLSCLQVDVHDCTWACMLPAAACQGCSDAGQIYCTRGRRSLQSVMHS